MKVPEKGTIDDPRRWKKHRPVKWVARTQAYRDNWNKIDWKVKRADDPFSGMADEPGRDAGRL